MKGLQKILKWLNYVLILSGILSLLYVGVFKINMGILIPVYILILVFLNLIIITAINRISGNSTVEVFKDWKCFFALLFSYLLIMFAFSVLNN